MNERIKELWNRSNHDEEVFAELIIRECAAEADKQTIYCRGIPWGRWIKQHFGVE